MLSSDLVLSAFMSHPAKRAMRIPPRGSMRLDVTKSNRSKKVSPKNLISAHQLNDHTVPSPNSQVATPEYMEALIRDNPKVSISHVTRGSIKEIDDVQAATSRRMKKSEPKARPPGMLPNATGSVWKMRPGPESGSILFANTIGKMAMPANKATRVSARPMIIVVLAMEVS